MKSKDISAIRSASPTPNPDATQTPPQATHTPTPWRIDTLDGGYASSYAYIYGSKPNGEWQTSGHGAVAIIPRSTVKPMQGNAELIVRAVNAHAALVAALRQIIALAPEHEPEEEDYDDTESAYNNGGEIAAWEAAQIARAALAMLETP